MDAEHMRKPRMRLLRPVYAIPAHLEHAGKAGETQRGRSNAASRAASRAASNLSRTLMAEVMVSAKGGAVVAGQNDSQLSLSPAVPVALAELVAVVAVGRANAKFGAFFTDFRLAVWDEPVVV